MPPTPRSRPRSYRSRPSPPFARPAAASFVTVWPAAGSPVTIDGNVAMPGFGLLEEQRGRGAREVFVEYGGGLRTLVGHGSVATPGAFARARRDLTALRATLPWSTLVQPAYEWARDGFRCPRLHTEYLKCAHDIVFGVDPRSHRALHDDDGQLKGYAAS